VGEEGIGVLFNIFSRKNIIERQEDGKVSTEDTMDRRASLKVQQGGKSESITVQTH